MTAPMLSIRDLSIRFGDDTCARPAVQGFSLDVSKGECVAIVGESGSGKSQTFLAALGLTSSAAKVTGSIMFDGQELVGAGEACLRALRASRISMIFQNASSGLAGHLTIGRQLTEVLEAHGQEAGSAAHRRALEMLEAVRLRSPHIVIEQYPAQLSGGMNQRVMIAMALIARPELIIADEPTTALDVTIQAEVLSILKELQAEQGAGLVFISHDLAVVSRIADRIGVMKDGVLVELGEARQVIEAPSHAYTRTLLAAVPRMGDEGAGMGDQRDTAQT
ncbi:MAG: ABC transporter ATP-binding protein [Pseudomonadota bacterium]